MGAMATAVDVNTYVDAAITAIDGGDWSTAHTKLLAAKAALVGLPDASEESASLRWDRNAIDELIEQVKRQIEPQTTTTGFGGRMQMTKLKYTRG